MGVFSGLKEAASTQGGNYIQPGNYLLKILRVKMQSSQVGNRQFFVAELRVLEARKTDPGHEPNGVDTEPSWLVELPGQYPSLSLGNIKAFLHAAFSALAKRDGVDPPDEDDIDEGIAEMAVSSENPLVGVEIVAKAFHKKKRDGSLFTRVKWGESGGEEKNSA